MAAVAERERGDVAAARGAPDVTVVADERLLGDSLEVVRELGMEEKTSAAPPGEPGAGKFKLER